MGQVKTITADRERQLYALQDIRHAVQREFSAPAGERRRDAQDGLSIALNGARSLSLEQKQRAARLSPIAKGW